MDFGIKLDINNITVDDILECGKKFYTIEASETVTRYRSWKYCHDLFVKVHNDLKINNKKIDDVDDETKDKLCLYLSYYLASWGMNRNSFLLWVDYKVHADIIKIIFDEDYFSLWDMEVTNCNEKKLNKLIEKVKSKYEEKKKSVYEGLNQVMTKNKNLDNGVTDTLISKVLLGTLACVPAYDTYFKIGIKYALKPNKLEKFNSNSIKKLADDKKIKEVLKKIPDYIDKPYCDYPHMKLLDSCFWQLGYYIDCILKNKNK